MRINSLQQHVTIWMGLTNIILSKHQTQKIQIIWFYLYKAEKQTKLIKALEIRTVVPHVGVK